MCGKSWGSQGVDDGDGSNFDESQEGLFSLAANTKALVPESD